MDNISIERNGTNFPYEVELRTDIGRREEQQDHAYAYVDESLVLAIVCDGMGGTEDGARASKIAIESMQEMLKNYLAQSKGKHIVEFLAEAMTTIDANVSNTLGKKKGGTTAVAILIFEGKLYWFSAGDSRLYILRNGELVQATRDHNYFLRLNEQLESGEITEEYYQQESPRGEALISYMGAGGLPVYDLTNVPFELRTGDILLLTSDGLYKAVPEELIKYVLRGNTSLSVKADRLIEQIAILKNSVILDNTTFALIKIEERGNSNE